ncbi:MAG: alpha/beta fold hydrolase [Acidimicrobiales bacterium]
MPGRKRRTKTFSHRNRRTRPRSATAIRTALGLTASAAGAVAVGVVARRSGPPRTIDDSGSRVLEVPAGMERRVTMSDGALLAVTDAGDGPLVVCAHGWTEVRGIWSLTASALLAQGHRVVMYDQRGHGESSVGREGITIERLGLDLAELLVALDAREAILVGHSMGGMTIMSLLATSPEIAAERASGAVLVATAAGGLGRIARFDAAAAALMASARLTRLFAGRAGPRLARRSLGRTASPAHVAAVAAMFARTSGSTRRECAQAMLAMDLRPGLAAVSLPVTVVVGGRDRLTPPRLGRRIADEIPGSQLVTIAGAGHQLQFEYPDRLADIIDDMATRTTLPGVVRAAPIDLRLPAEEVAR